MASEFFTPNQKKEKSAVTPPGLRELLSRPRNSEKGQTEPLHKRFAYGIGQMLNDRAQRIADGVPIGYKKVEPQAESNAYGAGFEELGKIPLSPHPQEQQEQATVFVHRDIDVIARPPKDGQSPRLYRRRFPPRHLRVVADEGTTDLAINTEETGKRKVTVPEGTQRVGTTDRTTVLYDATLTRPKAIKEKPAAEPDPTPSD